MEGCGRRLGIVCPAPHNAGYLEHPHDLDVRRAGGNNAPSMASQLPRHPLAHPAHSELRFQLRGCFKAMSCPPPSIDFQSFRPEPGLNSKCLLFTSCRGLISPCFSYKITTLSALLPNSNSCTPRAHGPHPFISEKLGRCII